jgi:hypothetical protein
MFLFATWSMAFPIDLNILTLAANKSFLSMPSRRGMAPTNIATSTSLNASISLHDGITSVSILKVLKIAIAGITEKLDCTDIFWA